MAVLPPTDNTAGILAKYRRDDKSMQDWISREYDGGIGMRALHARSWIKVLSIMSGCHYFRLDEAGVYIPIAKRDGEIRGIYPIMEPNYRRQMGRLATNRLGIVTTPTVGHDAQAQYRSERAGHVLEHWIEESNLHEVQDDWNQHLLHFGMTVLFRHTDEFRRQVRIQAWPATEIFPIPFDAPSPEQCDGFLRVKLVSKAWCEQQDAIEENRQRGMGVAKPDFARISEEVGPTDSTLGLSFINRGGSRLGGSKFDGATAMWVWMKPSPVAPRGEYMLFVNRKLKRYFDYLPGNEANQDPSRAKGPPLEFIYYDKRPNDFWGYGFCESLIAPQLEANLQFTSLLRSAHHNRSYVLYDPEQIKAADIQNELSSMIPWDASGSMDNTKPPFAIFGPNPLSRDVSMAMMAADNNARRAAGFESDIVYGMQEGRTDSAQATELLNTNADAPVYPVIDRTQRALSRIYPAVLDDIRVVWPEAKAIRVVGARNMGKELMVKKDEIPSSENVQIAPSPMLPNGRSAILQMLFQMKQIPNDAKTGPMITDAEFRSGLTLAGMVIPGLELSDTADLRVRQKVSMIMLGQWPPYMDKIDDYEDHTAIINVAREFLINPSILAINQATGKNVSGLLQQTIIDHQSAQAGRPVDKWNRDVVDVDGDMLEASLDFAEQNMMQGDGFPLEQLEMMNA